ncbi:MULTISPECIES: hypothetical protein [unclassified Blastomonas]|jgi:hypothetical protein|uniref:hypothetical protein n=1 Tax=unclassified Blastomonas TaxID=2626550 RepID=UPI00082670F1|nr:MULTISPECIES: hypothetical protein [unclassified Blastomonas]
MSVTTECSAKVWDRPTAGFYVEREESVVGIEITDLGGRLVEPMLAIFVVCNTDGTKVFLDAETARMVAAQILNAADHLDAGATTLGGH